MGMPDHDNDRGPSAKTKPQPAEQGVNPTQKMWAIVVLVIAFLVAAAVLGLAGEKTLAMIAVSFGAMLGFTFL